LGYLLKLIEEIIMQKKTLFALLAMLAFSMPAYSLELPSDATPQFGKSSTAYSSSYQFNSLLEAYGLTMAPEAVASVPSSYAKVSDDQVVFNNNSIAYTPVDYHTIITAYGVELLPEAVSAKLGGLSYAKIKNDTISFSNTSTAYSRDEWSTILSAYSLPPIPEAPVVMAMPGDSDGDGVTDDKDKCPGTPYGVAVGERGCWALSNAMLFDFDSAVIKPEFNHILDYTKEAFDAYPDMNVQVDGHTDSTGAESYNQMLSEKRATAIMNYLINSVGIEASRLKAVGHGEIKPGFSNDTKENRAKNRRVEFTPLT
jgi:outer membrane protein OmpA-like peptidoglycan-associated protein